MKPSLKKYIIFLQLQTKAALLMLPKIFLCMLIFALLLVTAGFGATKLLSNNQSLFFFKIAAALPEEDALVSTAFNIIANMDSLDGYCEFIETDIDTAREMLKNGEIYGIIEIPEGFVEDVLYGVNTPARVIIPDDTGMETMLFKAVLNAGSDTLAFVQSGIYAVMDTYDKYDISSEETNKANEDLNMEYIHFFFNRGTFFDKMVLSTTGNISLPGYYICSAILLLMLFTGMTLGSFIGLESSGLLTNLSRSHIKPAYIMLSKLMIISILYSIIFLSLIGAGQHFISDIELFEDSLVEISFTNIILFFICTLSVVSFLQMCFSFGRNGIYAALLIFALNTIMAFVSGYILPGAYLPDTVAAIGNYLPTGIWHGLVESMYTQTNVLRPMLWTIIYACVFYGISVINTNKRRLA